MFLKFIVKIMYCSIDKYCKMNIRVAYPLRDSEVEENPQL